MSENMSPVGLKNLDASGRSAGDILREAREAQGLSLEHLAVMLKVAPIKLAALEEGRIDQLPDANFARALAQTMCRMLKIDPAAVLAGLPAAKVAPLHVDKPVLNQPFKETRLTSKMFEDHGGAGGLGLSRWMRPQWLAPIALLVAAAVIYLLPDSFELPRWIGGGESTAVGSQTPSAQTSGDNWPAPVASAAEVLEPAVSASLPDLAAPAASSALPFLPPPADLAASQAPVAMPTPAAPQLGSVAASAPSPLPDEPVALSVSEASWIEVVDGNGNTRLSRVVRAGESLSVGGTPPWRVRIGHVGGVKVTLRGQPVDLAPFARNNVARLELK